MTIWLDRIGAITAGRGLAGHLDAALAQDAANGAEAVVVTLILCDPLRDNQYEDEVRTGAMADGPFFGRRFPAEFETLVRNAYPPIG